MNARNYLLDGLRGVAALAVVCFHVGMMTRHLLVPGGYLAVDFFFILSGFVLDQAYRRPLEKELGSGRFMLGRMVRLYPVFLAGAAIGIVRVLAKTFSHHTNLSVAQTIIGTIANVLLLPVPFSSPSLYPVNNPAWSLALEVLINVIFAVILVRSPRIILWSVAIITACTLTYGAVHSPYSLNLGWRHDQIIYGSSRACCGFTLGMLIARAPAITRPIPAWLPFALLVAGLCLPISRELRTLADIIFALIGAPLIVLLGQRANLSPRLASTARWLGALSFPIYAVHYPLMEILHSISSIRLPPPVLAVAIISVSILVAIGVEVFVDKPARQASSRLLSSR